MPEAPALRTAQFDPAVKTYFMVNTALICVLTVVGIVLLPFILIIGRGIIQKYLDRMSCTLTERTLELKRGIFSRVESTIPLEKITDLQMFQGPMMRAFGLYGFKVETAGQTTAGGALMSIIGIVDAPDFRQAVLEQRDQLDRRRGSGSDRAERQPSDADLAAGPIAEIRDAVLRIEALLQRDRAQSK